ncbi:hypothetical protein [Natrarchaeobaculum aegyptiacum]|uniref:Uncharacterized protein n=1 Tax=Natrarchaeobaculum aegyptiacum TaxID=745377 RepID=A0A2Z2I0X2_9EURY|nr:hypothetical protein [Natrarchaeobaculum aegyptiacum]ARS89918.1 hypothetical protein B1756_09380 [Natrarchaeobaculum aegyptiacum]
MSVLSHLRRIILVLIAFLALLVLGIVIDGVTVPIIELGEQYGLSEGPFSTPFQLAVDIRYFPIAIMLVGLFVWLLVGPIVRTRREEQQRRVGPP